MNPGYLIIIPALAIGWGLGSYRQTNDGVLTALTTKKETTNSQHRILSGTLKVENPDVAVQLGHDFPETSAAPELLPYQ